MRPGRPGVTKGVEHQAAAPILVEAVSGVERASSIAWEEHSVPVSCDKQLGFVGFTFLAEGLEVLIDLKTLGHIFWHVHAHQVRGGLCRCGESDMADVAKQVLGGVDPFEVGLAGPLALDTNQDAGVAARFRLAWLLGA